MAKARMLSKSVSLSRQLAALKNDTHRLVFTWLIPHADIAGRLSGDPSWVRAAVVPMLGHVTRAKVEAALADAERVGVIQRYTDAAGQRVVALMGWERHQALRADKEASSTFGPPPDVTTPGRGPSDSGPDAPPDSGTTPGGLPEDSRPTPAQMKRSEEEGKRKGGEPVRPRPDLEGPGLLHFDPAPPSAAPTREGQAIVAHLGSLPMLRSLATPRFAEHAAAACRPPTGKHSVEDVCRALTECDDREAARSAGGGAPKAREELAALAGGFLRNIGRDAGGRPRQPHAVQPAADSAWTPKYMTDEDADAPH
jgi:hypothetical protein